MGSFSNYLEVSLLDHVFGTGEGAAHTFARPDKWIALCKTAVIEADSGVTITEPTSGSYGRVLMSTWDKATAGATENTLDITYIQATGNWGTILDFAICDAETDGNVLAYGSLTVSKSVESGDTPKFAVGDLDITLG